MMRIGMITCLGIPSGGLLEPRPILGCSYPAAVGTNCSMSGPSARMRGQQVISAIDRADEQSLNMFARFASIWIWNVGDFIGILFIGCDSRAVQGTYSCSSQGS